MATDKSKHLECVLKSHKITNEGDLLDKHIDKREEVKEALEEEYGSDMYSPFNSGSYAKNTAVNKKFDFDLIAPFKRDSFDTLEDMYTEVYDFLYNTFKSEATIRKQKVSIGLEFFPDKDGDVVKIDVVPGRELNTGQYPDDNKLNLYVHDRYGNIAQGSERLRTNVKAQIENIRENAEKGAIRQIIRLLKVWKINNRPNGPKSFFIELITIKAFDKKNVEGDLWEKLKIVMEYIRDEVKTVNLPDPGNNGNNISDTLTDSEKENLSNDMKNMITQIEYNSDHIKTYFPVNSKFPCETNEKSQYGVKKEGISTPPPSRFG